MKAPYVFSGAPAKSKAAPSTIDCSTFIVQHAGQFSKGGNFRFLYNSGKPL
jgi:hypothetical protein